MKVVLHFDARVLTRLLFDGLFYGVEENPNFEIASPLSLEFLRVTRLFPAVTRQVSVGRTMLTQTRFNAGKRGLSCEKANFSSNPENRTDSELLTTKTIKSK